MKHSRQERMANTGPEMLGVLHSVGKAIGLEDYRSEGWRSEEPDCKK